ncbi:MAG: Asp-tRNA(Asn)/Glu-tRNA(Gln) amidotransferase subunit GatB [Bacilli bacterium]|nr:Asp-tRNA(Asn)/Glu-tRNA(Gln) amidotransferase subunit GatB [Bacilli bacterium]
MELEAVIGLEIHVQTKTRSKMFSSAPNAFGGLPNTQVGLFDVAFPGTMPSVNKEAVVHALRLANALHMQIDPLVRFDRKNYFYPDLPKGFQITQQFHPLGKDGYLDVETGDNNTRRILIQRLHMEEDTCKQTHFSDYTLLDYNRAGIPLLEVVTEPMISSGQEAMAFVEALRRAVTFMGISDGKMEEGSLRCDVNVSLREKGEACFGPKVEIKNLNSIRSVGLAIDFEIKRQTELLENGKPITQETRRYDERSGETVWMRDKENEVDYHYLPEPNIPPIRLSEAFIRQAIDSCPESYEGKKRRYLDMGISRLDAEALLSDAALSSYFDKANQDPSCVLHLIHLLLGEVLAYLNAQEVGISSFSLSPDTLFQLAKKRNEGFTHQQVVDLFDYCLDHSGEPVDHAVQILGLVPPSLDVDSARLIASQTISDNPQSVLDYRQGKDRAFGFLVGQALKRAKGRVDPSVLAKVMAELLKKG